MALHAATALLSQLRPPRLICLQALYLPSAHPEARWSLTSTCSGGDLQSAHMTLRVQAYSSHAAGVSVRELVRQLCPG